MSIQNRKVNLGLTCHKACLIQCEISRFSSENPTRTLSLIASKRGVPIFLTLYIDNSCIQVPSYGLNFYQEYNKCQQFELYFFILTWSMKDKLYSVFRALPYLKYFYHRYSLMKKVGTLWIRFLLNLMTTRWNQFWCFVETTSWRTSPWPCPPASRSGLVSRSV